MEKTVVTRSNVVDLINATIDSLIQAGIELPALSTLRRIAASVLQNYQNQLFHQINQCLSEDQRVALNAILDSAPESSFARLCQPIDWPISQRTGEHFHPKHSVPNVPLS